MSGAGSDVSIELLPEGTMAYLSLTTGHNHRRQLSGSYGDGRDMRAASSMGREPAARRVYKRIR